MAKEKEVYVLTVVRKGSRQGRMSTEHETFKSATLAADMAIFAGGEDYIVDWPWRIDRTIEYETQRLGMVITREARE